MFKHHENQSDSQLQHARSSAWVVLTVLSAVALVAHTAGNNSGDDRHFQENWSLIMILISLVAGSIAIVFHVIHTQKFVSSKAEILVVRPHIACVRSAT